MFSLYICISVTSKTNTILTSLSYNEFICFIYLFLLKSSFGICFWLYYLSSYHCMVQSMSWRVQAAFATFLCLFVFIFLYLPFYSFISFHLSSSLAGNVTSVCPVIPLSKYFDTCIHTCHITCAYNI